MHWLMKPCSGCRREARCSCWRELCQREWNGLKWTRTYTPVFSVGRPNQSAAATSAIAPCTWQPTAQQRNGSHRLLCRKDPPTPKDAGPGLQTSVPCTTQAESFGTKCKFRHICGESVVPLGFHFYGKTELAHKKRKLRFLIRAHRAHNALQLLPAHV